MNKTITIFLIVAVLIGGGAFYGGMLYGRSQNSLSSLANLTPQQRQQRLQQFGAGSRQGRTGAAGSSFISGQVIAKDDKSLTVQLSDGSGSKIIFFSPSTQIMKTATSTIGDLQIGENLSVNGQVSSDGSITAQTIQIRPNLPERATTTPAN